MNGRKIDRYIIQLFQVTVQRFQNLFAHQCYLNFLLPLLVTAEHCRGRSSPADVATQMKALQTQSASRFLPFLSSRELFLIFKQPS